MTGNLPAEGKKLWEKVYEESKSGGDDEETAAKKAWGACKEAGWKQDKDEKWVQDNVSCADGFDEEIGIFSNGGSGSGNFGHKGRSGEVGGSAKDGDSETGNSLLDSVRKRMKGTSQWTKKKREEVIKMMMKRGDEWTGQTMDDLEARAKEYNDDLFARFGKENVMKGLYPDEFKEFEKDISAYREMLYDARMRSFKNAQAPSQDYHWLVRLFSKSKQEKHTMDMNQELVTKILNEAGYTVNFVDGKNVTATPSAAHLSETLTGLESIVNEMGGTAKFKEMLLNVGKFPTCIQNLTDTLNEVKGNVQAATVMAQNAAAKAEAEKKDFVARLIANAQCPFNEEELNAMALNALQKLEASYRPTNYAALGAGQFVDVANAAADDILGVPSLFQE
jgi:hypothetical protein